MSLTNIFSNLFAANHMSSEVLMQHLSAFENGNGYISASVQNQLLTVVDSDTEIQIATLGSSLYEVLSHSR